MTTPLKQRLPRLHTHLMAALSLTIVLAFPFSALAAQPENALPKEKTAMDDSAFSFMGMVESGETYRLLLHPGENVKKVFIETGEIVEKGQLLVQLGNDTLTSAKYDLLQKQNQLETQGQQLEIVQLETRLKQQQLNLINQEIQEESRLATQVKGYISTVSKQLENQKMVLTGELEILNTKLEKMKLGKPQQITLEKILSAQLSEIETRQNRLKIVAPFPGEVMFLSPDPLRTPPGSVVCELWGKNSYQVRGRVMQHQIEHTKIGDILQISLDFSKRTPLEGKIISIQQSRMAPDNQGGYPTFDVLVDVVETAQWLRPGMMVSMKRQQKKAKD